MKRLFWCSLVALLVLNGFFAVRLIEAWDRPEPLPHLREARAEGGTQASRVDPNTWTDLKAEDLPSLVAHLRTSGFPAKVIREIVKSQIHEANAARRDALELQIMGKSYWMRPVYNPKNWLAFRRLDREEQEALEALVGSGPGIESVGNFSFTKFSYLAPDREAGLRKILGSFQDKDSELNASGVGRRADRARYAALERDRDTAIAVFLSPDELLEYKARTSETASKLQYQLQAFEPSESEYRKLVVLQSRFDEQARTLSQQTQTAEVRRQAAESAKQLSEQIKQTLGPERTADYERATNNDYMITSQLVTRLELPEQTAKSLWSLKDEYTKRATELAQAATSEERETRRTALEREAKTKIATLLGDPSWVEVYQMYGGSWLEKLSPPKSAESR